jgi:hypothetical protein
MADLEQHVVKRDKRFLVRLVLGLLIGVLVGGFLYGQMTSPETGACAADLFGVGSGGGEDPGGGGSR